MRAIDSAENAATAADLVAIITVIDGGSTDGTRQVVQDRPGIRVIDQDGIGLAAARNQGLAETEEPLVAWLDADDRWPVESLRERLAALEDSAELVVGQVAFEQIGPVPDDRYRERWSRTVLGLTPGALLARRTAFDTVGSFDTSLAIGADSEWFARAARLGVVQREAPTVVLVKGIGDNNTSHNVPAYRNEILDIVRRHGRHHDRHHDRHQGG